jgi:hypothetical protein
MTMGGPPMPRQKRASPQVMILYQPVKPITVNITDVKNANSNPQ